MSKYIPLELRRTAEKKKRGRNFAQGGGQEGPCPPFEYASAPSILGRSNKLHNTAKLQLKAKERAEFNKITCPLTTFPVADGQITSVFTTNDLVREKPNQLWLNPKVAQNPGALDRIVASEGNPGGLSELKRTFRSATGKQLLKKKFDMTSGGLLGADGAASGPTRYVIVREDRLQELCAVEKVLQKERSNLGDQATWLFNDTQASTRIPKPFIIAAVNTMCDKEIHEAEVAIVKLRAWRWQPLDNRIRDWEDARSSAGPIKMRNYTPKEHRLLAPLAERPPLNAGQMVKFFKGRWLAWKEAAAEREEEERQTMIREEAAQHQLLRGWEAQERRTDYAIYVALAMNFGELPEDVYIRLNRPGAYFKIVVDTAVTVLETFWVTYWPYRVARKRQAARHYQRLFRSYRCRKIYQPVFAFRDWRTQKWLRAHLLEWRTYAAKLVRAREFLLSMFHAQEKYILLTWHEAAKRQREAREATLERISKQFLYRHVFSMFNGWAAYVYKMQRVKSFVKRILGNIKHHIFENWAENVANILYQKSCMRSAVEVQRITRGYFGRKQFVLTAKRKNNGCLDMQKLFRGHRGRVRVTHLFRDPMLQRLRQRFWQCQKRKQEKILFQKVQDEEERMEKELLLLSMAEYDMLDRNRAEMEAAEMAALHNWGKRSKKKKKKKGGAGAAIGADEDAGEESRHRQEVLLEMTRVVARHEFRRLNPPLIEHAHPTVTSTFVSADHYKHYKCAVEVPPTCAEFHMLLRNAQGWPLFQEFLEYISGGHEARDLRFWRQCQGLKRYKANSRDYQSAAEDMCRAFIAVEDEIRVSVPDEVALEVRQLVEAARMSGTVVPVTVFHHAEWAVFCNMEKRHEAFVCSPQGARFKQVLALAGRNREHLEVKFFERRRQLMIKDARAVKAKLLLESLFTRQAVALAHLRARAKYALWNDKRQSQAKKYLVHMGRQALALQFLAQRVALARFQLNRQAGIKRFLILRAKRAQAHCDAREEAQRFLLARVVHRRRQDDALVFLQVTATMSELCDAAARAGVVHERQKVALAYLLLKAKNALVHVAACEKAKTFLFGWGCFVLAKATPEEKAAALLMQRQFRARIARRQLRMLLNSVTDKVYDPNSGRHYYFNKRTGEVSWEKPLVMGTEELLTPRSFKAEQKKQSEEAKNFRMERRKAQRAARGGFSDKEAAIMVQRNFRTRISRRHYLVLLNATIDKVYDENSESYYYYNKQSGEVNWTKPHAWKEEEEIMTPRTFAATQEKEVASMKEYTQQRKRDHQKEEEEIAKAARKKAIEDAGGMTEDIAARIIQSMAKKRRAYNFIVDVIKQTYKLTYDAASG
jgi:hypothetical protein